MRFAYRRPMVQQLQLPADAFGQRVFERRDLAQRAMHDGAQRPRVYFRDAFIHRNHAAHVQRGVGIFIVIREQFELGVQHGQFTGVIVELDFAEKRQAPPRFKSLRQVLSVKPLGAQHGA